MQYRAPLEDIRFCLDQMVGRERLIATGRFPVIEDGTADAILEEAARVFEEKVAPAHRVADSEGARFENGVVRTPPEFHRAFAALRDGGWVGIRARTESGGPGMPQSLVTPVNEMLGSACLALSLCPLLTQGVIIALEQHGSEEQKRVYLPKLVSGEWAGTMVLTEAHAGSDVGALTSRAEPNGDGSWSVTGQKVFISWGESDLTENIVHLVLARTPNSPPGTAGISLFLVPKLLPFKSGGLGARNALRALSIEKKMGLHGSPTAVLSLEGARGWLVGNERDGMACMFTMMNAARLGVGIQGVSVAESSRQLATRYAVKRRQGPTRRADQGIIGHEDVRRMVLTIHALTAASRAICYDLAVQIDLASAEPAKPDRDAAVARAHLLTPLAKAFGSDAGCEAANLAIQVHGGAGYIEETGASQLLRDARIAAIYEGTNGIQAMDLVGRKLAMNQGTAVRSFLDEIEITVDALEARAETFDRFGIRTRHALALARSTTDWMLEEATDEDRRAGAVPYLRLLALVRGAHYLGRGALHADNDEARVALADFYTARILPEARGLAEIARAGAEGLYALSTERMTV